MAPRTTVFTSRTGYAGFFFNRPPGNGEVSATAGGAIVIHNQTAPAGDKFLGGGIWIGRVASDPDVSSIVLSVTTTFTLAQGITLGVGYTNASAELAGGAVDVGSGAAIAALPASLFQVRGFAPFPWSWSNPGLTGPRSVFSTRLVIAKPPSAVPREFLVSFQINTWTGGGLAIEADANVISQVDSVVVSS